MYPCTFDVSTLILLIADFSQSSLFLICLKLACILPLARNIETLLHPCSTVRRKRWILMISVSRSEAVIPEQASKSGQGYSTLRPIIRNRSGCRSALTVLSSKNVDFRHWGKLSGEDCRSSLTESAPLNYSLPLGISSIFVFSYFHTTKHRQ